MLRYAVTTSSNVGRLHPAKPRTTSRVISMALAEEYRSTSTSLGINSSSSGGGGQIRFQSTGNSVMQKEDGNHTGNDFPPNTQSPSPSTNTSSSPSPESSPPAAHNNNRDIARDRSISIRRPEFLQTLKVQTRNPISQKTLGSNFRAVGVVNPNTNNHTNNSPIDQKDKRFDSSKLRSLLRNGPAVKHANNNNINNGRTTTWPTAASATQSNLQGHGGGNPSNNNNNTAMPDLVGFFRKRLQQVKLDVHHTPRSPSPTRQPTPFRRGPPPPATNNNNNQRHQYQYQQYQRGGAGLQGAMAEANIVRNKPPTTGSPTVNLNAILKVIEHTKASGNLTLNSSSSISSTENNNNNSEEQTKKEESSPIRKFIVEMQKQNKQKKEDAAKEPQVPSWRKSAQNFADNRLHQHHHHPNNSDNIDPLFSSSTQLHQWQQQQKQDGDGGSSQVLRNLHQTYQQENPKLAAKPGKPKEIVLPWSDITVRELSSLLGKKVGRIMKCLEDLGESPKDDEAYRIDADSAEMVAMELNVKFTRPKRRPKAAQIDDREQLMERRKTHEVSSESSDEELPETTTEGQKVVVAQHLVPRPPVVCIMGHVDHGKTTLMDALRRRAGGGGGGGAKSKNKPKKGKKTAKNAASGKGDVAGTEAGGITQIISAFQVPLSDQQDSITFLDTPGHAAFSAMRLSGSHAADIIVLVVAADDGVSPQTIEILNFYKSIVKDSEGGISMVVAMNKIDKPGIDVNESKRRIENQLLEQGIIAEGVASHNDSEYGSPVQFIPISAKTGEGLEDLIEGLSLQSEVMDLRADDKTRAEGIVMDARVEHGLGVVVDCIVRWGSIQPGDVVVSGTNLGKVRILKDVNDKNIKKGSPSQPVRVIGFKTPPKAGDPLVCVASERVAEELVERRLAMQSKQQSQAGGDSKFSQVIISGRESMTATGTERRLERYDLSLEDTGPIRIPIIVKAKADGSVAAVRDSLKMLGKESSFDLDIDVISQGVGPLTRSEIEMAKESKAAVFCFDVKNNDKSAVALAEAEGVPIHEYNIIYALLDDAKEIFTAYLPPVPFETVHGKAAVQAVFDISGGKETIAGLKVLEGYLHRSAVRTGDSPTPVYYRVIRGGVRVSPDGDTVKASSLKKFKEDVDSVRHGEECGLSLSGVEDFQVGDVIECFSVEMKKSFS